MRSVTQQLRGFSDIEPPPRAEDGCLETLPDEQQEIKNNCLHATCRYRPLAVIFSRPDWKERVRTGLRCLFQVRQPLMS